MNRINDLNHKYKEFLSSLGIESDLRWDFALIESKKHDNGDKVIESLLNNIAFSFFEYKSKEKLYQTIQENKLEEKKVLDISFLMIENYDKVQEKYPINKILIEKFVDYFIQWIHIIDNVVTKENIEQVLKNVHSKNQIFWFYLIKKLYEQEFYQEALLIIEKKKELFTDGYFLEDIVLKEIECLRQANNNYLNNKMILQRLCDLSKHIKNYKYTLVILELECALLSGNKSGFDRLIEKYYDDIKDLGILEILNIYELSILNNSHRSIGKIYLILLNNDIQLYNDFDEYKIFELLESIREKNWDTFRQLREDFEMSGNYDFKHIDWYLKINK